MSGQPDLAESSVRALAANLLGGPVELSAVRTGGMETDAFRVAARGQTGCLRIGRSVRGFAKDRWAFETLGPRLPVPRVWELGELEDGLAFCLTEWAPGVTLQDLPAEEVRRVLPAVFDAWRVKSDPGLLNIAEHGTGYGDFEPDPFAAPSPSWSAALRETADLARSWAGPWVSAHAEQLERVVGRYETLIDRCPEDRRSLVHGDWGTNNILVAGEILTGILDWEAAMVGDPLLDVGGRFWEAYPPVAVCTALQADYCDQLMGGRPNYRDRVQCYDLRTGLDEIDGALTEGDLAYADWALARCCYLLDLGVRSTQ